MKRKEIALAVLLFICFMPCCSEATLHDRAGGLIYDDVLNVTWLQDASYAITSGYDADGYMMWPEAVAWAEQLSYYDPVRNKTWTNWRLPSVRNLDGSTPIEGYLQTGSEMGHLFYVDLQNEGWQPIQNTGPFINVQPDYYWFREEGPLVNCAWYFNFWLGYQNGRSTDGGSYAWAVMDGDVGVPPDPTPTLTCSGFDSPMNNGPVKVKKNRVLPLKAQLLDQEGFSVAGGDVIAPPILQVKYKGLQTPATDVTDQALSSGAGTDGNQFQYIDGQWQFNLQTKNYTAKGTYEISILSGDVSEYRIEATCGASFVIE